METRSAKYRIVTAAAMLKRPVTGTVVVIDNLRASSTIVTALEAGVHDVVPVQDDALAFRYRLDTAAVLAGESGGIKRAGYDIGNSPVEVLKRYAAQPFARLILNTSNCVPVLARCTRAVICSSLNIDAVARYVAAEPVTIVAVGGAHGICEDMGVALALSCRLGGVDLDDESLQCFTRESAAARHLRSIGYGADVDFISRINTSAAVAVFNGTTIALAHGSHHR